MNCKYSIQQGKIENDKLLQGSLRDALKAKSKSKLKEYEVKEGFSIAAEE